MSQQKKPQAFDSKQTNNDNLTVGLAESESTFFLTSELTPQQAIGIAKYLKNAGLAQKDSVHVDVAFNGKLRNQLMMILGKAMVVQDFGKYTKRWIKLHGKETEIVTFSNLPSSQTKLLLLVSKEKALISTSFTPNKLMKLLDKHNVLISNINPPIHSPASSSYSSSSVSMLSMPLSQTLPRQVAQPTTRHVAGGYGYGYGYSQEMVSFHHHATYNAYSNQLPLPHAQIAGGHPQEISHFHHNAYLAPPDIYRNDAKKEIEILPNIHYSALKEYVKKYPDYLYFLHPKMNPETAQNCVGILGGKVLFSCGEFPEWDGEDYVLFAQSPPPGSQLVLLGDIQDGCAKLVVDNIPKNCTLRYHMSCSAELILQVENWCMQREKREAIQEEQQAAERALILRHAAAERELMLRNAAAERELILRNAAAERAKLKPPTSTIYTFLLNKNADAGDTRDQKQQYALQTSSRSPQLAAVKTSSCPSTVSSLSPFFSQQAERHSSTNAVIPTSNNSLSDFYSVSLAPGSTPQTIINNLAKASTPKQSDRGGFNPPKPSK